MNRNFFTRIVCTGSAIPVALLMSSLATLAVAQQTNREASTNYISTIFVKVPSGQEAAFLEHYKTGAGAKTIQARIKANPEAVRWSLMQAVYPGNPAPEANFMIVSSSTAKPTGPDPAKQDAITRSAAGMSYADYMKAVRGMSETVGQTLSHLHETTGATTSVVAGDYVVLQRLKVADGKAAELDEMMHSVQLPLAAEGVKAERIKAWSYSHLVFPGGDSVPYSATTAVFFKDLASAVTGGFGAGAATFAKLFPNKNYLTYSDSFRASRKVVRRELYRVVATYAK